MKAIEPTWSPEVAWLIALAVDCQNTYADLTVARLC